MVEQLTKAPTESDFEARIDGVLRAAFPWIPGDEIKHQLKFKLKLGRTTLPVRERDQAEGRLDILISHHDVPLAVLELKREGSVLTADDKEQTLSYARALPQMAPLAILSNGQETKTFAVYDGSELKGATYDEKRLSECLSNLAKVAQGDLKQAIQTLMGHDNSLWIDAVRASTECTLAEMEGTWAQPTRPFVKDFLFPRKATAQALHELGPEGEGKRIVLITGAPLAGKSSVLREIAIRTKNSLDFAVLYVEIDSVSHGIFRYIAGIVSESLGWSATEEDVRHWLRGLSGRREQPRLVIALDGISLNMDQVLKDLDELTTQSFGEGLRILATIDDTSVAGLTLNETGRKETRIGRQATQVEVKRLDDSEFQQAERAFHRQSMAFMKGAKLAAEYREPWILRAVGSAVFTDRGSPTPGNIALLPPLLGLQLLNFANNRFSDLNEYADIFQDFAECVIQQYGSKIRDRDLILPALRTFMVDKKSAIKRLTYASYAILLKAGLAKTTTSESGSTLLVPRLQEYLSLEVAKNIARRLTKQIGESPQKAAQWLIQLSSALPLGDVIGAQAILNIGAPSGGIPTSFFDELLADSPKRSPISPGTHATTYIPGVGTVHLRVLADGAMEATAPGGEPRRIDTDGDFHQATSGGQGLLILSHLGSHRMLADTHGGVVDAGDILIDLMIKIAKTPTPLRRPSGDFSMDHYQVHEVDGQGEVLCHHSGMLEPITISLMSCLLRAGRDSEQWLRAAAQSGSLPLLSRLAAAMAQAAELQSDASEYFKEMSTSVIEPALKQLFPGHEVDASCP